MTRKSWQFDKWIRVFCFELRHLTYYKYYVEFMPCLFIEKDFELFLVFDEVLIL